MRDDVTDDSDAEPVPSECFAKAEAARTLLEEVMDT